MLFCSFCNSSKKDMTRTAKHCTNSIDLESKSNHWFNVIFIEVKRYLPVLKYTIAAFCSLWWQLMYDIGCLLPILAWNCPCAVWQPLSCGIMMHTILCMPFSTQWRDFLPFLVHSSRLVRRKNKSFTVQKRHILKLAMNNDMVHLTIFNSIKVAINHLGQIYIVKWRPCRTWAE